jgi:hypothetical protein
MFEAEASIARAGTVFDDDEQRQVRQICQQLDGMPLALELAAARLRSMSLAEVTHRLDHQLRLLKTSRSAVERHRTLEATIAWSYDLLQPDERRVFELLAVFADGCLLDGIVALSGLDDFDVLDILDRLVARSMVVATDTPLGTRYRELESLRQYAEERLAERGELAEARRGHTAWAVELARWVRATEFTPAAEAAFLRLVAELGNVRAAVASAVEHDDLEGACEIVGRIASRTYLLGLFEVIGWLDPTAGRRPMTRASASATGVVARLRWLNGDQEGGWRMLQAIPEQLRDNYEVVLCGFQHLLWTVGDPEACKEMLDAFHPADPVEQHNVDLVRCYAEAAPMRAGRLPPDAVEDVLARVADAVDAARRSRDTLAIANALAAQSILLGNGGRADLAIGTASEAVALAESMGAEGLLVVTHSSLGWALGHAVAGGVVGRVEAAQTMREFLVEMAERGSYSAGLAQLEPASALLVEHDPRTAYVLSTVFGRTYATGTLFPAAVRSALGPEVVAELEARAAALSNEGAVALAIAALDELLAEAGASAAGG